MVAPDRRHVLRAGMPAFAPPVLGTARLGAPRHAVHPRAFRVAFRPVCFAGWVRGARGVLLSVWGCVPSITWARISVTPSLHQAWSGERHSVRSVHSVHTVRLPRSTPSLLTLQAQVLIPVLCEKRPPKEAGGDAWRKVLLLPFLLARASNAPCARVCLCVSLIERARERERERESNVTYAGVSREQEDVLVNICSPC